MVAEPSHARAASARSDREATRSPNSSLSLDLSDERCAHCGGPADADIVIRCPLCKTAHHLECYARERSCGLFSCLGPDSGRRERGVRNPETIAAELFLAGLRERRHDTRLRSVALTLVLALIALLLASLALAGLA